MGHIKLQIANKIVKGPVLVLQPMRWKGKVSKSKVEGRSYFIERVRKYAPVCAYVEWEWGWVLTNLNRKQGYIALKERKMGGT